MIQKTDLGIKWGRYGMIAFLCAYVLVVLLVGGMSASATVEGEERGPRPVVKLDKEEVVTASLWGDDFGYEVEYIGESVYTSAGVDFGDWDGDGDLDLAVANSDGPVQVYENVEGTFLLDTANGLGWVAPITRDTVSVDWGDWDGDGDLDLALGNNRETSQVYENVDGEYLVLAWTASVVQPTSAVAWGDWDGDGDLDLAFGNEAFLGSMRNYVYENVGGNLVQAWESPDNTRTSDIAWGDYDGDGDLDLAAVNLATQANVVYENTGGNLALNVAGGLGWVQPSGKQVSFAVEWGDVDGDGDLDLAFGNDGADQIYFNEGGELTLGWSASSTDQSYGLAFADWDGDGDLDLAAGAYLGDQSNRIYENDGTGNMLLDPVNGWGWQEDNTVSTFDLVWADADNDGDIDLVLATSARTRIYVNNSGLLLPAEGQRMETDSFSVDWGDYDGDGDLDLAMASHAFSEVVAYENVDNQLLRLPSQGVGWSKPVSGTVTRMMAVAWGDVDGDGDLDLAAGTDGGLDLVYENDNGTFRLDPSGGWGWTSEVMSNTQDVAWGDYDGDGDLDLAMALYGDRNRIYENVGGVLSFDLAAGIGWEAPLKQWTRRIDWGDWDGDGDLDLAVANENNANRVYENVGGDLELAWEAPDVYNSIDIEWGDYDGDGDLDLAVANEDELTHIWENVGKELRLDEANGFGWSSPRENDGRLAWGDYDGDGDLDLFVSATYYYNLSSSYIYENVGDGFVGHSFPIVANDAVWGDYDGDGDLDLGLAPLFNNEMFVYENNLYTNDKMVANLPQVVMDYPGAGAESVSGGVSGILTDNVIPITYTVSDPEGDVMGRVGLFYSLNGGGEWLPAVAAAGTLTTNVPSAAFPVATADTYTIAQNYTLTLPAPGLLANDTASEAVLATPPLSGTLAMDIKGGFVYTPALGFTGIETFTYSARNGIYEAAPTTVAVNVVPNTAPIAQTDVYTTYQVVPLYMDVVAND
ncbi:MAG TPA: FG-GAP-like repeat-containing protein, partial [Anaerolineae bacterium]|nr:FG-GAP-like repeat-containing protein [Anaerolineae bacterium]